MAVAALGVRTGVEEVGDADRDVHVTEKRKLTALSNSPAVELGIPVGWAGSTNPVCDCTMIA
jgi:hypothetical protein